MSSNIFIDANVLLDLFDSSRPFYKYSVETLKKLTANEDIELFISSDMLSNIFYILKNRLKYDFETSVNLIENFARIFNIVSIDRYDILHAVELCKKKKFRDFEDALQYICALKVDAELIISNDKKGFKNSIIQVKTSKQII